MVVIIKKGVIEMIGFGRGIAPKGAPRASLRGQISGAVIPTYQVATRFLKD